MTEIEGLKRTDGGNLKSDKPLQLLTMAIISRILRQKHFLILSIAIVGYYISLISAAPTKPDTTDDVLTNEFDFAQIALKFLEGPAKQVFRINPTPPDEDEYQNKPNSNKVKSNPSMELKITQTLTQSATETGHIDNVTKLSGITPDVKDFAQLTLEFLEGPAKQVFRIDSKKNETEIMKNSEIKPNVLGDNTPRRIPIGQFDNTAQVPSPSRFLIKLHIFTIFCVFLTKF